MSRSLIASVVLMSCVSCQGQAGSSKVAAAPPKTAITSAKVQGQTLVISGTYFAPATTVTLGGAPLKIAAAKPQELTVALPDSQGPGNYLLGVSGGTPVTTDAFTVTIGAAGPPGPSGPPGSSASFPSGLSMLSDSPVPPKGFVYTGFSVISQGGSIGWSLKAPIPTPRMGAAVAIVKGTIYVIGGVKDASLQGLTTVEAYDIATDAWSAKAPIPTGRGFAGVGILNGSIYVVGGSTAKDVYTGAFEVYDPVANKWSSKAAIPTPKNRVTAAVVNNTMYVIGDFTSFATPSAATGPAMQAYDAAGDTWAPKTSLPSARASFSVAVLGGMIYAIGGSGETTLATVDAYDPATNTWVAKAPMPAPRKDAATGVINGLLYVAGGRSDTDLVGAAVAYDPMHDSWSPSLVLPIPVESAGAGTSEEGVLYLVGGASANAKIVAGLQAFTPSGPKYYIHKSQ
jgi:N-acetylneuraminic acid mutarotase